LSWSLLSPTMPPHICSIFRFGLMKLLIVEFYKMEWWMYNYYYFTSWSYIAIEQGINTSKRCQPHSCEAGGFKSWVHLHLWIMIAMDQIFLIWNWFKCRFGDQFDSNLLMMCSPVINWRILVLIILCRKVIWFIDVIVWQLVSHKLNFVDIN